MIELYVSDNDVTNGSIAVSWCLSTETLDYLATRESYDPQLVICIVPNKIVIDDYGYRPEYRKVVPLKDLMTYLEFRVPGKNTIFAYISASNSKESKNVFFEKHSSSFEFDILTSDKDEYRHGLKGTILVSDPITVNVPDECFAPEPAAWEKAWVNHMFSANVKDQCDFRRRRIFAYTVQPLLGILNMSLRLLATLFALLVVVRNISFAKDYLLHPLSTPITDFTDLFEKGSYLIKSSNGMAKPDSLESALWYFCRRCWKLPFTPLVLLAVIGCFFFKAVWIISLMILGLILFMAALMIIIDTDWISNSFENLYAFLTNQEPNSTLWYMNAEEIEYLSCSKQKKATSVSQLPAAHRTFKLRFQSLKSKVCRPFSS